MYLINRVRVARREAFVRLSPNPSVNTTTVVVHFDSIDIPLKLASFLSTDTYLSGYGKREEKSKNFPPGWKPRFRTRSPISLIFPSMK